MSSPVQLDESGTTTTVVPRLAARGLVKRYGHVQAIGGADFELLPGEVLAVVGDNGAGKSSLIKALIGAVQPDEGELFLDGEPVRFRTPAEARARGIETVFQDLAMAPSLDIATNMFMGRELRKPGLLGSALRLLDRKEMRRQASANMAELKIGLRSLNQAVETLSGGQRQGVAVARAAAWASSAIFMDEPTAALGVKESAQVLELIAKVRDKGVPVVLISHNMPHVFEIADRIHIHRLGRRVALVRRQDITMPEVVGIMTGAIETAGSAVAEAQADAEAGMVGGTGDALG
jgi:fructose transport system ATP-binding protein